MKHDLQSWDEQFHLNRRQSCSSVLWIFWIELFYRFDEFAAFFVLYSAILKNEQYLLESISFRHFSFDYLSKNVFCVCVCVIYL